MSLDPNLITGRLNVNDFLEARQSDIQKLENLLHNSGTNSKQRAFQSLPRTERRRAASHDPKRVPRKKGLRKRAEFESLKDNSKKPHVRKRELPKLPAHTHVYISTIGQKADPPKCDTPGLRYGHRQRDKIWLPTHIWHKKRAHMINMAGIVIPQSASQKQFRRSYRLTHHIDERGAMAWDSSYYSTFLVRLNDSSVVEKVFPGCNSRLYRSGKKLWQGVTSLGGPASVYWYEESSISIQCNPLLFDELWDTLATLPDLELEDCRYAIGNIDIIGPQKFQIVQNVLNLKQSNAKFASVWREIIANGIAPSSFIAECLVGDPRLDQDATDCHGNLYIKNCRQKSLDRQMPQSTVDTTKDKQILNNPEIPVTIMLLQDGRIRLSLPKSWVLVFWLNIFRKKNVLLGGQLELNQLAFEFGLPCFPYDFPHIHAGHEYLNCNDGSLIGPKRARASKAKVETTLTKSSDLCHVLVDSQNRGVPKTGDLLNLFPGQKDGIVTSGNFGYSKAKGTGIGLFQKNALVDAQRIRGHNIDPVTGSSFEVTIHVVEDEISVL